MFVSLSHSFDHITWVWSVILKRGRFSRRSTTHELILLFMGVQIRSRLIYISSNLLHFQIWSLFWIKSYLYFGSSLISFLDQVLSLFWIKSYLFSGSSLISFLDQVLSLYFGMNWMQCGFTRVRVYFFVDKKWKNEFVIENMVWTCQNVRGDGNCFYYCILKCLRASLLKEIFSIKIKKDWVEKQGA